MYATLIIIAAGIFDGHIVNTSQVQFFFECNYNVGHVKGKASTTKQTCLSSLLGPKWNSCCVYVDFDSPGNNNWSQSDKSS